MKSKNINQAFYFLFRNLFSKCLISFKEIENDVIQLSFLSEEKRSDFCTTCISMNIFPYMKFWEMIDLCYIHMHVIFDMTNKSFIIIFFIKHFMTWNSVLSQWLTYVLLTSNWKFFFMMLPAVNPTNTEGMPTVLEPEENNNGWSP